MKKYLFKIAVLSVAIIMPFSVLLTGCDQVPTNPESGSSTVGTPENSNGGSSTVGTPTNPDGGGSEGETPSTPANGDDSNEDNIVESSVVGDLNNDGVVTEMDLNVLNSFLNDTILLSAQKLKNADVNGDKSINEKDYTILFYYIKCGDEGFVLPYNDALYGDINLDGLVNAEDYKMLNKFLPLKDEDTERAFVEGNDLSIKQLINADVNLSGKVNKKDYSILKLYVDKYNHEVDSAVGLPYTSASWGDVNLSGSTDVLDVFLFRQSVEEDVTVIDSLAKYINADVNFDGVVDVEDYNFLLENNSSESINQKFVLLSNLYSILKSGNQSFSVATQVSGDGVTNVIKSSYDAISKVGFYGNNKVSMSGNVHYLNIGSELTYSGTVDDKYALYMALYGRNNGGVSSLSASPITIAEMLDYLVYNSYEDFIDNLYAKFTYMYDDDFSEIMSMSLSISQISVATDDGSEKQYKFEFVVEQDFGEGNIEKTLMRICFNNDKILEAGAFISYSEEEYSYSFQYEVEYSFDRITYNELIAEFGDLSKAHKVTYCITWNSEGMLGLTGERKEFEVGANLYEEVQEIVDNSSVAQIQGKVVDKIYLICSDGPNQEISKDYVAQLQDEVLSNNSIIVVLKDVE